MNASAPTPTHKTHTFLRWHRRVLGICLALFAFELGLVLLFFPWVSSWDLNWVPLQSAVLAKLWMSPYFRGALSGLGLLNIYVGVAEMVKQLRQIFGKR